MDLNFEDFGRSPQSSGPSSALITPSIDLTSEELWNAIEKEI